MSERVDIVVAGGGMVGAVFASLAARDGLRVALIDAGPLPVLADDAPTGARVVALARGSQRILETSGAWEGIAPHRRCAYERMRIWDEAGAADARDTLVFDCADVAEPDLGHIVENQAIAAAASQAARAAGVTWHDSQRVSGIEFRDDYVRVTTESGLRLRARLLVAADGAASHCREVVGIGIEHGAYQQEAVVAHLTSERPHERTAWQRFLGDGPLALLPLADGRVSLVWSTEISKARRLTGMAGQEFLEAVTTASDSVLGTMTDTTPPRSFPLNWLHAREYCRPRFALLGDAAHCVHPLAGQGVNLGLLDAASLLEVLRDALDGGTDPGSLRTLRRYSRWRRSENALMVAALTGLNRLFRSDDDAVALLRRAGMGAVNRAGPIKRSLIRHAMGMGGDLPRMLRGATPAP